MSPSLSKIAPADSYWTSTPESPTKLRMGESNVAASPPISIIGALHSAAEKYPNHPALVSVNGSIVTYFEYEQKVHLLAKAFIKIGLSHRHSVAILSNNCPEWFYSELAAIYAGGMAAGIYTTNSPESVLHILQVSRANIVVVDSEIQLKKVLSVRDQLPLLKAIVQIDSPKDSISEKVEGVYQWCDLTALDLKGVEQEYVERQSKIYVNEAVILVFTSGTTGMPKGAMLSHDNILWNCTRYISYGTREMAKEVIISYLPLNHVGGQIDIFISILSAGTVHFGDSAALKGSVLDTLAESRPTYFVAYPRIYEKLYERLIKIKKSFVSVNSKWAEEVSLEHHLTNSRGNGQAHWRYLLAQSMIFNRLRREIGLDCCKLILCAAAPMTPELKKYLLAMDLPVMDVYGMSESSGHHILSNINDFNLRSIGKTMPGGESKIDKEDLNGHGELCLRGRNIFMGYIANEEKTAEAFDADGWLHSGDIGYKDKEGFVYITGRLKEIVITKGGENIPPVHVEHLVKNELPCISNAVLIGDQQKYLTMLITLKTEVDPETGIPKDELTQETVFWMRSLGLAYTMLSEVIRAGPCPKVLEAIMGGIKRANENAISKAQEVQKFKLLERDFSIATGEIGPTGKTKRHTVIQIYADVIEKMYAEDE